MICTKCGISKIREDFYTDKKTGRPFRQCKDCKKAYVSDYQKSMKAKSYPRSENPKYCNQCGQIKPVNEFYSNKTTKTGLTAYCKNCTNANNRRDHQIRRATKNYLPTTNPKVCTVCGLEKPAEMFYPSPVVKSGRVAQCIDCTKEYRKSRNYPRQTYPKVCKNCGPPELPDRMFTSSPYHRDGRETRCNVCMHKKTYNPEGQYTAHDYLIPFAVMPPCFR